jgi:phosphoserine aminotransferase
MMSKAVLHLMHKDEVVIRLEKELTLLSHANKNSQVNKPLIQKLEGSIDALKWVLGFDYINKEGEENAESSDK